MRILTAVEFAERAHRGQVRKYTGEPYIVHPLEVAGTVASVTMSEDVIIAALFHDIVEDTDVSLEQIRKAFGDRVAQLVHEVTDISRKEHGNRAARKALDRQHLATASVEGKTIKLADLISNTQSIVRHDPNFAMQRGEAENRENYPMSAAHKMKRATALTAALDEAGDDSGEQYRSFLMLASQAQSSLSPTSKGSSAG